MNQRQQQLKAWEHAFCFLWYTPPVMDTLRKPKIIVIVGQTGSGKTSLSLELAKKFNGEVINADSRQVYRGLDIGTEKITQEAMNGVPHHLLDIVEPEHIYTAQQFAEDAQNAITDITQRNAIPVIAGGTFFYIDILLGRIVPSPVPPNRELRKKLEAHDESELHAMLEAKDPARAAVIDKYNKRRLLRALEILHVLPSIPSQEKRDCPFDTLLIGIAVDKRMLRERLRARAERALKRGLVEETKDLLAQGVPKERLSEIGLEYRLVLEFLGGGLTEKELLQKLEEKNWQYAKRQMVWLKRDPGITWFERGDTEHIFATVDAFLRN